jgi:hypothetical protein
MQAMGSLSFGLCERLVSQPDSRAPPFSSMQLDQRMRDRANGISGQSLASFSFSQPTQPFS